MEHVTAEDKDNLLGVADLVIYSSCLEEQSFPSVLVQAMSLEKLVVAPDLRVIRNHVCSGMLSFDRSWYYICYKYTNKVYL